MATFQTDQLATLLTLVDEGTFERAAQRLHITASAVSQRIKAMEQTASQILVQRTNPVVPTAVGDIVVRHARQVALLEHDTALALGAAFGGAFGGGFGGGLGGALDDGAGGPVVGAPRPRPVSISIAVNADSLGTWFLDALAPLAGTLNAVFDLIRDDQQHTTSLLRSGTVLAAVTSTPDPVQGCTSEPLGTMRYRAVCSPAFAARWAPDRWAPARLSAQVAQSYLGRAAKVRLRNPDPEFGAGSDLGWLAEAPMLNFDRKDELQRGFLRAQLAHNEHPETATSAPATDASGHPPTHYVPTTADFARATLLGLGWALLPEQQCLGPLATGELVELAPGHPVDVPLYWQRWNLDSPILAALTDAVRAAATHALRPVGPTPHGSQKPF